MKGYWFLKKGLNEVAKFLDIEGVVNVGIKESNFIVKKEKETIIIRMLEGEFPKYEDILVKGHDHIIKLDKIKFGKMLKRMSILATDNYKGAVFTYNENKLVVTATNPDYGESKEETEIEFSGDSIEAAFNPKFFMDTLSVIDEEKVIINIVDGSRPCVVEGDTDKTFISVIMPMRIIIKMNDIYDANSIDVLEGLEPVRLRPSMYIGNVDVAGLHHLVYEVVDNSIDEAMAGYCENIHVTIHTDNSISVEDNGRGIPVDIHRTENVPAVEVVLTKLHAGGKFDNDSYKVSGGLHGVGVSVVNALSKFLEIEIYSEGQIYYQTYERGLKISELKVIGKTEKRGTRIHFIPDEQIFNVTEFNYDILSRRLRELAFLNKGINIQIEDERFDKSDGYCYEGGIVSFVEYLNKRHTVLHDPVFIEGFRKRCKH